VGALRNRISDVLLLLDVFAQVDLFDLVGQSGVSQFLTDENDRG